MAAQRQKIVKATAPEEDLGHDDCYLPIEKLADAGVNAGDIKKAREAGYCTIQSLQMNHSKRLKEIKVLSESKIEKMLGKIFELIFISYVMIFSSHPCIY